MKKERGKKIKKMKNIKHSEQNIKIESILVYFENILCYFESTLSTSRIYFGTLNTCVFGK